MPRFSHFEEEGDGTWSGYGTGSQNNSNNQVSQGNAAPDRATVKDWVINSTPSNAQTSQIDTVGIMRNIALVVTIAQFFKK